MPADRSNPVASRRISYPTWNLLGVFTYSGFAFTEIAPVSGAHPRHPLPRFHLLVTVPAWLLLTLADDMISFWLHASGC
ncbi:hypothetical protein COCCU_06990 [Corynebacterium occultum]|uniref:Uncharacterized protein n=1 Tax=Corynebacterium occultum TaxID=2675219 RepID=A0A6B8VP40_9CORY|nr:hypothetical protein [Corynebacterium occultum]QGU07332.1 hypothetical protein COCCU_06990 [Corynebacterium occultum]